MTQELEDLKEENTELVEENEVLNEEFAKLKSKLETAEANQIFFDTKSIKSSHKSSRHKSHKSRKDRSSKRRGLTLDSNAFEAM